VIYQDLLAGKSPNTVIVPTSSSVEQLISVATEENDREEQDGVDSSTLAECVDAFCDRFKHSYPSRTCMREALEQTDKVSYFSFLMSLAKHESINQTIGGLNRKLYVLPYHCFYKGFHSADATLPKNQKYSNYLRSVMDQVDLGVDHINGNHILAL
ncbi:hypothetical protein GOODEAATRI_019500, partial [Goodea atripinnis]